MSTVYRLFDLDIKVYVIRENILELPVDQTFSFSKVLLDRILPKMNAKVISLDAAIDALKTGDLA